MREKIGHQTRSPDLTPFHYYFWGYLQSKVYEIKPEKVQELRQRIRNKAALISAKFNRRAISAFYQRLAYCQEVNRSYFQNVL
ncbi:hypothetical protein X777_06868 [Ooceraea biroi]|uniref:Uncharacterized protein n=1 Tax=Ooceraea biroi TaxID=2015173 RepID=A0A026WFK2_OOCBI|nr:hypothetical protein X777_06868 [Ooceraea biroi]